MAAWLRMGLDPRDNPPVKAADGEVSATADTTSMGAIKLRLDSRAEAGANAKTNSVPTAAVNYNNEVSETTYALALIREYLVSRGCNKTVQLLDAMKIKV